ncbi:MAG TPA: hypothetical protein PLI59_01640 [Candidatus Obscuribacter sp.]|nr:hypothetical protein [Candidatus Obscuribacter sp.]
MPVLSAKSFKVRFRALFLTSEAAAFYLLTLPAFWLIGRDYLTRRGDLSPMVAMHLVINQLVTTEQVPYVDFLDLAQPIIYELYRLPALLNDALGFCGMPMRLEEVVKLIFIVLTALSSVACFLILGLARSSLQARVGTEPAEKAEEEALTEALSLSQVAFPLAPVLLAYMGRFQLGEVQFLMALAFIPWIAIRYLAYRGWQLSPFVGLFLGAVTGLAFSLEFPYLLAPLALEAVLSASMKRLKPVSCLDNLGLVLAALVVALRLYKWPEAMQTAYWNWIMPLRMLQFGELDEMIHGLGTSPDLFYVFYCFIAVFILFVLAGKRNLVYVPVIAGSVIGISFFLLEKQGFTRDILLAMGSILLGLALFLCDFIQRFCRRFVAHQTLRKRVFLMLLAPPVCAYSAFFLARIEADYSEGINPNPKVESPGLGDINSSVQAHSRWREPVAILCDYPDSAYPLLFNLDRTPGTYLINGRPVRHLMRLEQLSMLTGHWKELKDTILRNLEAEFSSSRAELVLVSGCHLQDYVQQNGLLDLLRENYDQGAPCIFLSDNRQPREFIGFYYGYDTWLRRKSK